MQLIQSKICVFYMNAYVLYMHIARYWIE